ncbi:hypothetical protein GBAR_LOCUS3441, partial [Geodia barretti]
MTFQCNSKGTDVRYVSMKPPPRVLGIGRITNYHHNNPWTINSRSPLIFTIQYNVEDEIK